MRSKPNASLAIAGIGAVVLGLLGAGLWCGNQRAAAGEAAPSLGPGEDWAAVRKHMEAEARTRGSKVIKVGPTADAPGGPFDFVGADGATLRKAIDAASGAGDKVWIFDGTYTITGKSLWINHRTGTAENRWYFGGAPGNDAVVLECATQLAVAKDGSEGAIQKAGGVYPGRLDFVELGNFKITRRDHRPAYVFALVGVGKMAHLLIHDLEVEAVNGRGFAINGDENSEIHHVTSRATGGYAYRNYMTKDLYCHHNLFDAKQATFTIEDADNCEGNVYKYNHFIGVKGETILMKDLWAKGRPHIVAYNLFETASLSVGYDKNYTNEQRFVVANNVFMRGDFGIRVGQAAEFHVHNNVFVDVRIPIRLASWYEPSHGLRVGALAAFTYGNNVTTGERMIEGSGGSEKTWEDQGGNRTNADPDFVGETAGVHPLSKYFLKSASPCIDAGSDKWKHLPDLAGRPMQGKTIDIGPFEYCKEGFPKSLKIGRRTWAQQIAEQEQHD